MDLIIYVATESSVQISAKLDILKIGSAHVSLKNMFVLQCSKVNSCIGKK